MKRIMKIDPTNHQNLKKGSTFEKRGFLENFTHLGAVWPKQKRTLVFEAKHYANFQWNALALQ